jgi:hypothetical protein
MTPVQNFAASKVTAALSHKLKTTVSLRHIRIDLLNSLVLQGLYIEGREHDTVLYAGEVKFKVSDWFILRSEKPIIHSVELRNAYVHMYRKPTSNVWNYDFIVDAFSGKKSSGTKSDLSFDLQAVSLDQVRFHMDDAWGGSNMDFDIGSLALNLKTLDFKNKVLAVRYLNADNTAILLKDYIGGKPRNPLRKILPVIDSTPFNPDRWHITIAKITLAHTIFGLDGSSAKPIADEFDAQHLYIKGININASQVDIAGDTLHGNIDNLTAIERCGIVVKKMKAKVTVSPNASICDNLYLETNNSKLHNYYAMLYQRFPDFLDYINKVTMVIQVKNSSVDPKDIAYFAPQLRRLHLYQMNVTGNARGTVADLRGRDLNITDGYTTIKGDLHMKGLPDINKTYISYTDGEIMTSGKGIIKYAPALKENKDLDLDRILFAYYKGSFTGYIENFAVNGMLKTNLGTLYPNIKMQAPQFISNNIVYSGTVAGNNIDLGALLKQSDLGPLTFKATVNGAAFDPLHARANIDATIAHIKLLGYDYQDIYAHGTLERRKFTGNLLVNDPNLSGAFYGGIDYSTDLASINATANLLKSNFNALHLTNDTVLAVADLDLNFTGSNIDNFTGYAKLYNLDIKRNQHRLNLDSIYINSTQKDNRKSLTVQSNDVTASITGQYQLSKLPYSVQYYLSKYLPNYIKVPVKEAPEQDLVFNIATTSIDSLLGVLTPLYRGFDNSVVSGSLNTKDQKLTLHAKVPYGAIGNFHLNNVSVNGDGNLSLIELNTSIDNVSIGDSSINGSLSVTTTLGNDSLNFNIATVAPDGNSSVTLNGQILARRDSLFMNLLPSQFFLSQAKWNITGSPRIAYTDKYLSIMGLTLQSGIQKITVNSSADKEQQITVSTENVDFGQLGNLAGLGAYQPDGRLNGTITISNLFKDLQISSDIKATGVQFGADTIGNIVVIGNYNHGKKLITLDPQSGIYKGNATLIASGNMSFDSTNQQVLNGKLQFTNAPVAWTSPFLLGFMSHLGGTMNGAVNIGGTSDNPNISGNVSLANASTHIDFLGSTYTIPAANVVFTNNRIELGEVTLYDSHKNTAILHGHFSHQNFRNMRMQLALITNKFEAFNLHDYENPYFYGNLVCGIDSLIIGGPMNNINIRVINAMPAAKSHIYIPLSSSTDVGTYSYVSFKTYGKNQEKVKYKNKNKINISIDGNLNNLAELTIVMDPSTGDAINAKGSGHIQMQLPPNNDVRMFGTYNIEEGDYSFTFRQVAIHRRFTLNNGSSIQFSGPIAQTNMNVDATFGTKTRLYDLLSDAEKATGFLSPSEVSDAQTPQEVDVLLHMNGSLKDPKLTFNIDLPDKRSVGTYAYTKLQRINLDDQQLFDQVASLLLVYDFIPPEGVGGTIAKTGAVNNISQIVSSTASSQLTNLVNKLTGNNDVSIDLRYQNYNLADPSIAGSGINRNQVSVNLRKNYLNDRLVVEVGSTSDWGKPASTSTNSNFNVAGDFRVQYLLKPTGTLRANVFRTSDYDVTLDRNINRAGVGISWRKSFDGLGEFFKSEKKIDKIAKKEEPLPDTSNGKKSGTE